MRWQYPQLSCHAGLLRCAKVNYRDFFRAIFEDCRDVIGFESFFCKSDQQTRFSAGFSKDPIIWLIFFEIMIDILKLLSITMVISFLIINNDPFLHRRQRRVSSCQYSRSFSAAAAISLFITPLFSCCVSHAAFSARVFSVSLFTPRRKHSCRLLTPADPDRLFFVTHKHRRLSFPSWVGEVADYSLCQRRNRVGTRGSLSESNQINDYSV